MAYFDHRNLYIPRSKKDIRQEFLAEIYPFLEENGYTDLIITNNHKEVYNFINDNKENIIKGKILIGYNNGYFVFGKKTGVNRIIKDGRGVYYRIM